MDIHIVYIFADSVGNQAALSGDRFPHVPICDIDKYPGHLLEVIHIDVLRIVFIYFLFHFAARCQTHLCILLHSSRSTPSKLGSVTRYFRQFCEVSFTEVKPQLLSFPLHPFFQSVSCSTCLPVFHHQTIAWPRW